MFEEFIKTYGKPEISVIPSVKEFVDYEAKLPSTLLDFWRIYGWSSFQGGLIRFINPSQLQDIVSTDFLNNKQAIPIISTGFGNVYVWYKGYVYELNVLYGRLMKLGDDLELILDYSFCKKNYKQKVLWDDKFAKAVKTFGALAMDECFGFVPALQLGGSEEQESIQKVKLPEYLGILANLTEKIEVFD